MVISQVYTVTRRILTCSSVEGMDDESIDKEHDTTSNKTQGNFKTLCEIVTTFPINENPKVVRYAIGAKLQDEIAGFK